VQHLKDAETYKERPGGSSKANMRGTGPGSGLCQHIERADGDLSEIGYQGKYGHHTDSAILPGAQDVPDQQDDGESQRGDSVTVPHMDERQCPLPDRENLPITERPVLTDQGCAAATDQCTCQDDDERKAG